MDGRDFGQTIGGIALMLADLPKMLVAAGCFFLTIGLAIGGVIALLAFWLIR